MIRSGENGINLHFPTCVYYAYEILSMTEHQDVLDKCEEIKEDILTDGDVVGWNCNIKTSYLTTDLAKNDAFDTLINAIQNHIRLFCEQLNAKVSDIRTEQAWINTSVKGQYQETHTHPNSSISAIYYLKAPEDSGETVFKSPYEKQSLLPIPEYNELMFQTITYKPEVGKLLLFESHVPHLVRPNKSDGERMTLAANFTVL